MAKGNLLVRLALIAGLSLASAGCVGLEPYVKPKEARPFQTYVEVEGRDIHYVKRGEAREGKLPVMLFHGLGGSVYEWKEVLPRLAEKYEVYALDLPGFGDSEPVAGEKKIENFVESINEFMDIHELEKVVMIGHSMGSDFITEFASKHPEKLEMLISVSGYIDKEHTKLNPTIDPGLVKIPLFDFLARILSDKARVKRVFKKYTYDDSKISQGMIDEFYRNLQSGLDYENFRDCGIRFIERIDSGDRQEVEMPHFYIFGRQDNIVKVINPDYPNLIFIENCGHWVGVEKPDELAELIDKLIKEQVRRKREEKLFRLLDSV